MASKRRILITTGDRDGIGWEVTHKALSAIKPKSGIQFFCYRDKQARGKVRGFKEVQVSSRTEAEAQPFDSKTLVYIENSAPPAQWVEEAAVACLAGVFQALVTAPLSKTSIIEAGLKDIGHTEILARVARTADLFMGFCGREFSVVLATGHRPLAQAIRELNAEKLSKAIGAAEQLRRLLPSRQRHKPLALVGVNPHAGEAGLIGTEEVWMRELCGRKVAGPLVPDAAFLKANWERYSVYVCPYHDQGLIPFKMVHGFDSGVHVTLGLPFVRTSVDHGTAKDIYGKNRARAGSMREAITAALQLTYESHKSGSLNIKESHR